MIFRVCVSSKRAIIILKNITTTVCEEVLSVSCNYFEFVIKKILSYTFYFSFIFTLCYIYQCKGLHFIGEVFYGMIVIMKDRDNRMQIISFEDLKDIVKVEMLFHWQLYQ